MTSVDFLLVTALSDETEAVLRAFPTRKRVDDAWRVRVQGASGEERVVVIVEVGDMGPMAAQSRVRDAIDKYNPKRVILAGIAAGFPESGVSLGDLLIPRAVLEYQFGKEKEKRQENSFIIRCMMKYLPFFNGENYAFEPRSYPVRVSKVLFQNAQQLAKNEDKSWQDEISVQPPSGSKLGITVHCEPRTYLASGSSIVATEKSRARQRLTSNSVFPGTALGLEMESSGVVAACESRDKPFLVVQGVQDDATSDKDKSEIKDDWREWACAVSANYCRHLIADFKEPETELPVKICEDLKKITVRKKERAPEPAFDYTIRLADSYTDLKQGLGVGNRPLRALIPDAEHPKIVLQGKGGTGKTRILWTLIPEMISDELVPVFFNLSRASGEGEGQRERLSKIVQASSRPPRTIEDLEHLASSCRLVLVIDGLNEISRDDQVMLLEWTERLREKGGSCYLVASAREAKRDIVGDWFQAEVEDLEEEHVKELIDGQFGDGSWTSLSAKLQEKLKRPFFLSLVLRMSRLDAGLSNWNDILESFFRKHVGMEQEEVDELAEAVFRELDASGRLREDDVLRLLPSAHVKELREAGVVHQGRLGFEHELWRDFLVARHVRGRSLDKEVLNMMTGAATSFDVLHLIVGGLENQHRRAEFIKRVYDWNYVAAADCLPYRPYVEEAELEGLPEVSVAVLSSIAEKRFDSISRTRRRARELIESRVPEGVRGHFSEVASREDLVDEIRRVGNGSGWFCEWRRIFCMDGVGRLDDSDLRKVASDDSLVGWAASNLIRRSDLERSQIRFLVGTYRRYRAAKDHDSHRWRIVHALGTHPDVEVVEVLVDALANDRYMWVRYGAVRALLENAARADVSLRERILMRVGTGLAASLKDLEIWEQRKVLRETVECLFMGDAQDNWRSSVTPLLEKVEEESKAIGDRRTVERIQDFQES